MLNDSHLGVRWFAFQPSLNKRIFYYRCQVAIDRGINFSKRAGLVFLIRQSFPESFLQPVNTLFCHLLAVVREFGTERSLGFGGDIGWLE